MRASRLVWFLLAATLLVLGPLGPAAAKPSVQVLESPDVVVANPPENMTQDNFNPDYVFSAKIRIDNDDNEREINAETIIYPDPEVSGCPRDKQAFPVSFVVKNRKIDPGQTLTLGGAAHPQDGSADEYWPMAVSKTYRDGRTGQKVEIEAGEHTFCASLRVTGEDPACDKPANRTCVISPEPFSAYVRRENSVPEITEFSISEDEPRSGQEVLFQAKATDADTEPRPDNLRFTWELGQAEKTGKVVRHAFTIQGTHDVKLTVSDGFDTVERTATVTVPSPGEDGGSQDAPGPGLLAVVPVVLTALALRRRSRL